MSENRLACQVASTILELARRRGAQTSAGTVEAVDLISAEERATAEKIASQFDRVVTASLKAQGVAA